MKFDNLKYPLLSLAIALGSGIAFSAMSTGGDAPSFASESQQAAVTLDKEPATATFLFNAGTEGQTATFSTPDYFLSSKVTYGSNLIMEGNDNKGNGQTWFNVKTKESKADDATDAVKFLIQPNFGFSFTPTKVSFKATRYGTNGGMLDIAWVNPDGSKVTLATGQNPNRDNATPSVSDYSYTISGATPAEGACGLSVNIYSLDPTKHIGFSDIIIEGTLSGTEKQVPILASFKANGVEYQAEDAFQADGDSYTGTFEIAAAETMISGANPITDAVARTGAVGEITYAGDDNSCVATIPVTLDQITINYVATFVRKPLYTLTYYNTDGSVMGTQEVEKDAAIGAFGVDYTTAKAEEGFRVRGWFRTPVAGEKYTVADIITGPASLYAIATEIEVASPYKKYTFDLTDKNFYPEDHEAFSTTAGYWHDATHGWAFKNGDQIEILTGPKASVALSLCRYGNATGIKVTDATGAEVASLPGMSATETDGEVAAFNYEGAEGVLTLTFESTGELYLHSLKIMNTSEVNYTNQGCWYFVKPGDAGSLVDAIDAVNAANSSKDSERSYIFVPDGTYNLRDLVLTNLSGHNISLIGQSMEGTVIMNAPHYTTEGIGTTATLMNTGTGLYMQDLTIQNALDYYGAQSSGLSGARAVAFWDKGTRTVCKNVTLLSYQDTYYPNKGDADHYWETSDIHGTVDFICGDATLFMEKCTLTVEKRKADGSGECTITAPSTMAGRSHGYVFSNCTIDNKAASFNYGRAWSNEPKCAYINTTILNSKLSSGRWTAGGMNVAAKEFVEYNTMDEKGNVISPASHVVTFTKGDAVNKMETILTAEQAAGFTIDKVFPTWDPQSLTAQVAAPTATLKDGVIAWLPNDNGSTALFVFEDGKFIGFTVDTFTLPAYNPEAVYTVRAASPAGGLSPATVLTDESGLTSVETSAEAGEEVIYDLRGIRVKDTTKGNIYIINGKKVLK